MERLEEDKLNLRKQLLSHAVIKRSHAHHLDHVDTGLPSHAHSLVEEESKLREAWREEKRERESLQSEVELLKGRLTQTQEKVSTYVHTYVYVMFMCVHVTYVHTYVAVTGRK